MAKKNELTLQEFHMKVVDYILINAEWTRVGQAMWNCLDEFRPDLAERIHGTDLDVFYANKNRDDPRLLAHNEWIAKHWNDDPEDTTPYDPEEE